MENISTQVSNRNSILHVIPSFGYGGAETSLTQLANALSGRGMQQRIVVLNDNQLLRSRVNPEIDVHCLGGRSGLLTPKLWSRLIRYTKNMSADYIVGWLYHGNLVARLLTLSYNRNASLICNVRHSLNDWSGETWKVKSSIKLGALLSGGAGRVLFNAQAIAEQHVRFGYSAKTADVLYNGFDIQRFCPEGKALHLRKDKTSIMIGMMGRCHHTKGHDVFLKAVAQAIKQGVRINILLAGPNIDEHNQTLVGEIERHGLNDYTTLLGPVLEPEIFYRSVDILVSASRGEGFPNVIAEAMGCAVPIISTDVGGCKEVVENAGILVPPDDPIALCRAITQLCGDPHMRKRLGAAGRRRVCETFTLDAQVETFVNILKDV